MTTTLRRPAGDATVSESRKPPVTRLSLGRTVAELVLGSVLAVALSLVLQVAANHIGTDPGTYVPTALVNLASVVLLLVLFALLATSWAARWPSWLRVGGAMAALTAFATLLLAIPLQATRFFLGGSTVDNTFRLQYMERMTASNSLADMNYHGIAPYYPGGWFWLGGRFANLIGWDGWAAYKPYSILWIALSAVVAFVLWSLVVRRRLAVLASIATTIAGCFSVAIDEPYAWPTSAWLPPVAVLAWLVFRRSGRVQAWPVVLIGLYLGFAAITYTLHVAFGIFVIVVLAVVAGVLAARHGEGVGAVVKRLLLRLVAIGAITLVLALFTWGAFILAGGLGKPNVAAHFLPETSAYFPTPFEPTSVFGVLCLAGLVWLLLRARHEPVAFVTLTVTALVYVWFAVSTLALLAHTTLLSFRFIGTLDTLLSVAGVFGAVELLRHVPRLTRQGRPLFVAGSVLALIGAVSLAQTSVKSLNDSVQTAESDYYADGYNAKGEHDTSKDGAWTGQLISTVNELSGRAPEGNIVLSAYDRLLSFVPYWGFQQTTPHYANPLAGYTERNAQIRNWATASDSAELLNKLAANPVEAPNVFVLRKDNGKLDMPIASDTFPQASPVHVDEVAFDPALFVSPRFTQRDVGPFTVIVLRY
ncbi:arabinofuranosyltransferase [Amycolatopsis sp.]|uniref:arabinofuranosyltransferase n=1 Tax=Amycolatopsis sp. TaxID=37632 RepID=UPI002C109AA2|nr:arabinofuranosyltransferase [Amycolatopsis sp.]HVV13592.1 arabinofuranosyltransferase [Amycolatopsis sp.]